MITDAPRHAFESNSCPTAGKPSTSGWVQRRTERNQRHLRRNAIGLGALLVAVDAILVASMGHLGRASVVVGLLPGVFIGLAYLVGGVVLPRWSGARLLLLWTAMIHMTFALVFARSGLGTMVALWIMSGASTSESRPPTSGGHDR